MKNVRRGVHATIYGEFFATNRIDFYRVQSHPVRRGKYFIRLIPLTNISSTAAPETSTDLEKSGWPTRRNLPGRRAEPLNFVSSCTPKKYLRTTDQAGRV